MSDIRTELKRIDNILFEDAGTNGANDYMAQMSWILFLKYLDDLEDTRRTEAVFHGDTYEPLFKREYQWDIWAAPKLKDGKDLVVLPLMHKSAAVNATIPFFRNIMV